MLDKFIDRYVCPNCKGKLQHQPEALQCAACQRTYSITNNLPDFLLARPEESSNPYLRDIQKYGKLARFYETNLWYPLSLSLLAGWRVLSFDDLKAYMQAKLLPVKGLVLDVGTGTGTYGRRLASAERTVYGIDISLEMMRVGQECVQREGVMDMCFSRADVESLPFGDHVFDGCLASGCLHLFPDTLKALAEISRALKPGAPLAVVTVTWGKTGITKYAWYRRRIRRRGRGQVFELPTLQELLDKAGFEQFEPEAKGAVLLFTARKR